MVVALLPASLAGIGVAGASSASAEPVSPTVSESVVASRGDIAKPGVQAVKATVKARKLVVKVKWSSLAGKKNDRYRVRAVAMRGGKVTVLGAKSGQRSALTTTTLRLSRSDRQAMRNADIAVVGVSEHHRRARNGVFKNSFVASTKIKTAGIKSTTINYRDCKQHQVRPGANLRRCDFAGADLRRVNFSNTDLRRARLAATALAGAKFRGARIHHADFTGSTGANLKGAHVGTSGSTSLYWVGSNGQIGRVVVNSDGSLSCPAGGCAPLPIVGISNPKGIAVDANYLYWTNAGTNSIGRAALDGSAANASFITGNVNSPYGIAVDNNNVYWANSGSNQIGFAAKSSGGSGSILTATAGTPLGLATDATFVYWGDSTNDNIGQVQIAEPASINNAFVNGNSIVPPAEIDQPAGLSVNANSLWWTNLGATNMGTASLADPQGAVQVVPTGGMGHALGITNNSRYVYWADQGANSIGFSQLNGQGTPGLFGLPAGAGVVGVATTAAGFNGPTVSSVSPPNGWNDQTNNVTITGTGFDSGSTAQIGSSACTTPVVMSPTSLMCTVPADLPVGPYPVTVANSFGQVSNDDVIFHSTYQPPGFAQNDPVAPASGPIDTANSVRINGTNFFIGEDAESTTTVTFGSAHVPALPCTVDLGESSSTSLFCTMASTNSVVGPVDITLTNPNGGTSTLSDGFTFTNPSPQFAPNTPVVPDQGAATAQTPITITGSDFGNPQAGNPAQIDPPTVTIAGSPCTGVTVTNDQSTINCTVPTGAIGQRAVVITNPDGASTYQEDGDNPVFTYLPPPPQVLSVNPPSGPQTGGTPITITGANLVNDSTVSVGGQPCTSPQWQNPQQMSCVTPPGPLGDAAVAVTSPNQQTGSLADGFDYTVATPVIAAVTPSYGSVEGSATVTMTGSGFANGVSVSFGGAACGSVTVNLAGTSLECTTSSHAAGQVDIVVTNAGVSSTMPGGYFYGEPDFLYWLSPDSSGHIGRVQLDGGHPILDFLDAAVFNQPQAIAVDQEYLYWTNSGGNSIGRAKLDGSESEMDFISGPAVSQPFGIAVDSQYVYWTSMQAGTVGRSPLDGSAPEVFVDVTQYVTGGQSTPQPCGIAVDSENVYWGDCANQDIGSAQLGDPSIVNTQFIDSANQTSNEIDGPEGLAVAGGNLYWSNTPTLSGGFVGWVSLSDPGNPNPDAVTTGLNPVGVAANNANLYWANQSEGTIGTSTLAGASGTTISSVTDAGVNSVAVQPQVDAPPTAVGITSPSPAQGSTDGGTEVIISGGGFVAGTGVQLGGVECEITSQTTSSITCTTSAHPAGAADLTVINPDLQTAAVPNAFTYVAPPADVLSVLPPTGPIAGGTPITLSGSGFQPGITIEVAGVNCPVVGVVSVDGTTVSCTLPPGTVGPATIAVTNPGQSQLPFTGLFTYTAGEQVFWANATQPLVTDVSGQPCFNAQNGTIGTAASVAPAGANQCLVTETDGNDSYLYQPNGVAVDDGYVYWADQGADVIGRANIDGTDPQVFITLPGTAEPTGVAINGTYLYWSDAAGYIGRAELANPGQAQATWFATSASGSSSPQGLAISGSGCGTGLDPCIYWADEKNFAIGQVDLSGSNPNYSFVTTPPAQHVTGVAVDADSNYVYWSSTPVTTTSGAGGVYRTSTANPTTPDTAFVSGLVAPTGVTVFNDHLYWTDEVSGNAAQGLIGRVLISAPDSPQTQYISGANAPTGLAVIAAP